MTAVYKESCQDASCSWLQYDVLGDLEQKINSIPEVPQPLQCVSSHHFHNSHFLRRGSHELLSSHKGKEAVETSIIELHYLVCIFSWTFGPGTSSLVPWSCWVWASTHSLFVSMDSSSQQGSQGQNLVIFQSWL